MRPSAKVALFALISASWNAPGQSTAIVAGGPPGGAIEAIVIDPKDPAIFYAGTDWSGVFTSTDGGANWTALNTGLTNTAIHSLTIDPLNRGVLYAGTSRGVFKTVDAGKTWTDSSSGLPKALAGSIITMLAVDPEHPQILYAGTFDKIFKTIDGARSWTAIASHPRITQTSSFSALTVDPAHPTTIYVAAADSGLLKSADGGKSWTTLTRERVDNVLVDATDPAALFATSYGGGEILRSTDGGKSWKRVKLPLQAYSLALVTDPKNAGTIYAGSFEGRLFKSIDRGETWTVLDAPNLGKINALLIIRFRMAHFMRARAAAS
jgi:photosystem II stability/assembly factor-like uncharacterized protein